MSKPVRVAIVGIGGFAGAHHTTVRRLERTGEARLMAACDPHPQQWHAEQAHWDFGRRGVRVFESLTAMLAACRNDLDLVIISSPLPLHAAMHREVVAAGLAVYLEKPPSLDPAELAAMIELDQQAVRPTSVGFNFINEPVRAGLKQRLVAGEFGRPLTVQLLAAWPRPLGYFQRDASAERLVEGSGRLVLNTALGNAMGHFTHSALNWAAPEADLAWAQPTQVEAELYRVHQVEGPDTFFVSAATSSGVDLRIAVSLACAHRCHHCETILCEKAVIRYAAGQPAEVDWYDGRFERFEPLPFDPLLANHQAAYLAWRDPNARPLHRLVDCLPLAQLNALALLSSRTIEPIPDRLVSQVENAAEQTTYLDVNGLDPVLQAFTTITRWPSRSDWPRATPRELVTLADLENLPVRIIDLVGGTTPAPIC